MRIARIITLLLGVLLLASCSKNFMQDDGQTPSPKGEMTFSLGLQEDDILSVRTRSGDPERIAGLWYLLADAEGHIITPSYHTLEDDFSKLTIEGLGMGDYTLALLATTEADARDAVKSPGILSDTWLENPSGTLPLDGVWFYKRVDFHVGMEQAPATERVLLERCVGKVDVNLHLTSEYMRRFIRRVEISFDDGVHTALLADGNYSGESGTEPYDITGRESLYTLPGRKALSGSVRIESSRSDGTLFERRYRFEACEVEAGRIAHIDIEYLHPQNDDGFFAVSEEELRGMPRDTMFLASEPREVFYDRSRRSFYANAPLQCSVSDDHRLQMRFYSPVTIRDVTILCRFDKVSTEFFELAHFEMIYPFMEASFELPVVSRARTFVAGDGRRVLVPAQPELTSDDVTFMIRTEDPYMKKMEQIDSRWFIYFSGYSAGTAKPGNWQHMTPIQCRHGVVLVQNMAFMFSSAEFSEELDKWDGQLKGDNMVVIDLDQLRAKIRNHGGLRLGSINPRSGIGGLGGADGTYGLLEQSYREVYWDASWNAQNVVVTYVRETMFHEYAHCLGYMTHNNTMTSRNYWPTLCATVFVKLGREGKLPVPSRYTVENLPM